MNTGWPAGSLDRGRSHEHDAATTVLLGRSFQQKSFRRALPAGETRAAAPASLPVPGAAAPPGARGGRAPSHVKHCKPTPAHNLHSHRPASDQRSVANMARRATGRPPRVSGDLMEVQAVMLAAAEQARTPDLRFALRRHANRIRDLNQRLTDHACILCGEADRDVDAPMRCGNCGAHLRDEVIA